MFELFMAGKTLKKWQILVILEQKEKHTQKLSHVILSGS